ncbi:hypothetical protein FKP32DRAFT_1614925 [Trametes sanguinea]|nr:hypothetical protein FKP32DRAFT_1614925 [Trametes sanguinea]
MDDIPFDSIWCPVCSRQIVPKRIHVPVLTQPSPAPAPATQPKTTQQQDAHPRLTRGKTGTIRPRAAGLVHGTGRVKPNGTIKRSPTKDAPAQDAQSDASAPPSKPVRHRTVIDQSPVPLYCSDECRLADLQATHSALDINYNPDRCPSPRMPRVPHNSFSDSQSQSSVNDLSDCSSGASYESRSSIASPTTSPTTAHATSSKVDAHAESYSRLSSIYGFDPLPPPLPFARKSSKVPVEVSAPRMDGGIMMAARRIQAALCPEKPKRTAFGIPVQDNEDPNKPIPGWTDGSNAWRAEVYNFVAPRRNASDRIDEAEVARAYGSCVASPHRSRGVHSTLGEGKPAMEAVPNRSSSTASLPARVMDPSTERMYKQYSASFNRRSESRASLHHHARASGLSTSPTGSARSALAREVSIVAPGAEGRLLVPDVKMRRVNSSMSSIDGSSSASWGSTSAALSTIGSVTSRRRSPLSRQNSDASVDTVETQSDEDELEALRLAACSAPSASRRRMSANERSWSYSSETFTYPIPPRKPKIVKRIEKQVIDGVEQEVEVEVEEYEPIKRLFLFGGARD